MHTLALVHVIEAAVRPPPLSVWEEAWKFLSGLAPPELWHLAHIARQHPWIGLAFLAGAVVVLAVLSRTRRHTRSGKKRSKVTE